MTQLQITNQSGVPDRLVQRLAKFAVPPSTGRVNVLLRDRLRVYPYEATCYAAARPAIVEINLNRQTEYPYRHRHDPVHRARGSLDFGRLLGPEELLLGLLAHEFRHAWQAKHGKPLDETDADRWALSRLARWRV